MKIYKTEQGLIIEHLGLCYASSGDSLDLLLQQTDLYGYLLAKLPDLKVIGNEHWLTQQVLLAPIGSQEVWAAGVTYTRSKIARMEESKGSGGYTFYDKIYDAYRPEIFFKANASRVVGPQARVRIRKDSTWDVPEPELTLVINAQQKIVGYTIGNDMSSRSIEGENPLYLPQAKMYDGCAAIGPCIWLTTEPISPQTEVSMVIKRDNIEVFSDTIQIDRMKRQHQELVSFLFLEMSFEVGCFLMTGTGIVPGNDFTLQSQDQIMISIQGIGRLINTVA
jgi:2-dehydro-3-deoxy-D-arabinonate dehydratase